MAGINTVTTLLNQLDNMETKFRFYNFGNFLRVLQAECHIRISGVHHTTSHKSTFTTFNGRGLIFRIQTGQCREVDFSFCHTIRIITQCPLYILDFRNGYFGLQSNNLHFHLCRNVRDTILWKIFEVTAYFCRSHFDISCQFLLHLLNRQSVTCIITQSFTNLGGCFIEILLHFLSGTDLLDVHIGHHIHTLDDFRFGNLDTVQLCLMQE